jgi:uncharacterized membrane protein YdbT with pleckstrin-like domain
MIRLKSRTGYWFRLAVFTLSLVLLFLINQLPYFSFANWKLLAGLSVVLLLLFISKKWVTGIIAEPDYLTIQYYQLFIKRTFKEKKDRVRLCVLQKTTFRGGRYRVLQVNVKEQQLFVIDERDGFNEQDFNDLLIYSEQS